MNLYPQNLRDRQHAEIVKRRSYGLTGNSTPESYGDLRNLPPPQMGRLGRMWARRSGLNEKQAATGLPAASMSTLGTAYVPGSVVGVFGALFTLIAFKKGEWDPATTLAVSTAATAAFSYLGAVPWAAAAFRAHYKKPLTVGEIDALLDGAPEATAVEKAYLTLVRDAIRQKVPEAVEPELRAAVEALGQAIDRLPAVTVTPLDTPALRAEAASLLREAAEQTDRVIAESIERRADAVLRRCEAHERSAQYVRRSAALRAEIEAQIEALREGLAAFDAGLSVDASEMAHLSESARRVAAEAVSAADAREEVDSLMTVRATPARAYTSEDDRPVQHVGAGHQP